MQTSEKPNDTILALEAEVKRYTELLDKSIADKDALEKTKLIFHHLKILTEKLAEMKTATPHNKDRFTPSYLRVKSPGA